MSGVLGLKPAPAPETTPAKIRNNPEDQLRALLTDSGLKGFAHHAFT